MDLRKMRNSVAAFVAGLLLSFGGVVWAGLETGTYISDLVATNPLTSDLASTADDHIRLIKSTIKATFPNINGAISATDEEISLLAGKTGTVWTSANDGAASTLDADLLDGISSAGFCQTGGSGCPGGVTGAANPSASVGLSAVNGSATTFMRSDGAPALSQSITPTWTGAHVFTALGSAVTAPSILIQNNRPGITLDEQDGASNNQLWGIEAQSEQLSFFAATDAGSDSQWLNVNRTGNTVDSIALAATAITANGSRVNTIANTARIAYGRVAGASGNLSLSLNVTSTSRTGAGAYTVDLTAAGFTVTPVCVVSTVVSSTNIASGSASSSTAAAVSTYSLSAVATDQDFSFVCHGV